MRANEGWRPFFCREPGGYRPAASIDGAPKY
jgi:hypothetical protein